MKFSLIMGTLGRSDEVRNFLKSMTRQNYTNFEVIIADQNSTDVVRHICAEFQGAVYIKHLRMDKNGLSHARNAGARVATGDVLAFPDDDCEYPDNVLQSVHDLLESRSDLDGLTGVVRDMCTGRLTCGRFAANSTILTPSNVWRRHISCGMFVTRKFFDEIGGFDEMLGVGSPFGAGEETDFLLRGLYRGFRAAYFPEIAVFHPDPTPTFDSKAANRAYTYGLGFGALFKKHIIYLRRPDMIPECASRILRTLGGAIIYLPRDRSKSRYYLRHIQGWLTGFSRYAC